MGDFANLVQQFAGDEFSQPQAPAQDGGGFASLVQQYAGGDTAQTTPDNLSQSSVAPDYANANSLAGNTSADYRGLCQKFVDDALGVSGQNRHQTAYLSWQNYAQNGLAKTDFQNMKQGDLLYFAPDQSNGNDGHVGIYDGQGGFLSATYNGIQSNNVNDWVKNTGQAPLGYVPVGGGN